MVVNGKPRTYETDDEGVATATLYAACRQEGLPRSLAEVAAISRVYRKEIARTYR